MTPIEFGGGMIFPNRYDYDPPEPREPPECPECGETVIEEGDKYEWSARCEACGYEASGGLL
jgi:hypothetical protein